MPDLDHTFGGDLSISASGDLLTADSLALSQERVLRRLLTNLGDYLWQPGYGGGLPAKVGQTEDVPGITALIRSQMTLEATVLQNPMPQVNVTTIPNGIAATIQYIESDSGLSAVLSFDVGP
jgi:hypothetical protein